MTQLVCNGMDLYKPKMNNVIEKLNKKNSRLSALHQTGIDNSRALSAHGEFEDLDNATPCSRLHEEGPS